MLTVVNTYALIKAGESNWLNYAPIENKLSCAWTTVETRRDLYCAHCDTVDCSVSNYYLFESKQVINPRFLTPYAYDYLSSSRVSVF